MHPDYAALAWQHPEADAAQPQQPQQPEQPPVIVVAARPINAVAVTALCFALAGVLLSLTGALFGLGLLAGLAGVVLGTVGIVRARRMWGVGLAQSVVAITVFVVPLVTTIVMLTDLFGGFSTGSSFGSA
jgi:hypothetical protein